MSADVKTVGKKQPFPLTDLGNGELFAGRFSGELVFDSPERCWFIWGGHWWDRASEPDIAQRAKEAIRLLGNSAARQKGEKEKERATAWALKSEMRGGIEAMLKRAESELAMRDAWDRDPFLFAVANGIVDLRTGALRPGRREDYIRTHSTVQYDAAATCPTWERCMGEWTGGDGEMTAFLRRAVGYSLTGDNREQRFFMLEGPGGNGKGVFAETVRAVIGGYGHALPLSSLQLRDRSSISCDLAQLPGKRFVTISEFNEQEQINAALLKTLTGGDPIRARHLYGKFFEFTFSGKIWINVNLRPRATDSSNGFWRRVLPIRFAFTPAVPDQGLTAKLAAELPGILNWAIRGCGEWLNRGLRPPVSVLAGVEEYRQASDDLDGFLQAECTLRADARVEPARLYDAYKAWAADHGERPMSNRQMAEKLRVKGFEQARAGKAGTRHWQGIELKVAAASPQHGDFVSPPPAGDSTGAMTSLQ